MKKYVKIIITFICAIQCLMILSACQGVEGSSAVSNEIAQQSSNAQFEQTDDSSVGEGALQEADLYYYTDNGTLAIRLLSEGIVAFGEQPVASSEPFVSKFGLIHTSEEFLEDTGTVTYNSTGYREYDWEDYQHRLEKAHYRLKIHSSLETELEEIIVWILDYDDVIPSIPIYSALSPIRWSNEKILDTFIQNNCEITYFDDEGQVNADWRIYQGGCFADYNVIYSDEPNVDICGLHEFYVWLIDFSEDEMIIYDKKHVIEAGCGKELVIP